MPRMRTLLILSLVLFGCSDDKTNNTPPADAAAGSDAAATTPPLALDCTTYCTEIATACPAGPNQQYNPTLQNCMQTCAKFPLGTQADASGNTLGCRNTHIQNITVKHESPDTHCAHAGPAGGAIDSATGVCGDPCANFCKLEVAVCGTLDTPNTNITVPAGACGSPAGTNTNCFYQNEPDCLAKCAAFTKTPAYSAATQSGNTFACRLYHVTNAAVSTQAAGTHCQHTGPAPTVACN
jgi:hypothetical protein